GEHDVVAERGWVVDREAVAGPGELSGFLGCVAGDRSVTGEGFGWAVASAGERVRFVVRGWGGGLGCVRVADGGRGGGGAVGGRGAGCVLAGAVGGSVAGDGRRDLVVACRGEPGDPGSLFGRDHDDVCGDPGRHHAPVDQRELWAEGVAGPVDGVRGQLVDVPVVADGRVVVA